MRACVHAVYVCVRACVLCVHGAEADGRFPLHGRGPFPSPFLGKRSGRSPHDGRGPR